MRLQLPAFWAALAVLSAQDPVLLKVNQPVEREIAPGASHAYQVPLQSGDYLSGTVDQHGAVVDIVLVASDGSRIRKVQGPAQGKRTFSLIAEQTGTYRLELKPAAKSGPGKYEIKLDGTVPLEERLKTTTAEEPYKSPRIESLRKEVASGKADTGPFWQEIAGQGTPLVEPTGKEDQHCLVTFLWRGSPQTRNVAVLWFPFAGAHLNDYTMTRLAGTDVWFKTVRARRGARFYYRLSPNDPLTNDGPRAAQRQATAQADPLNPHRWFDDPGSTRFEHVSRVELPGAPEQPWLDRKPDTPRGTVEKHHIKSDLLKNERDLSVFTPAGYSSRSQPYTLIVLFDESAYLNMVPTPAILDNLIAARKIPPAVAVLIANPSQETRGKELPPNPAFADFLAQELIPWMHAHYNLTSDPRQTVIAGSSYGGIAATYAGLRHPETFGNILCQSGSFWWAPTRIPEDKARYDEYSEPNWLAKQFIASPKLPLKFYMDAGSFEVDMNGGGGAILEPSRHMRDVLLAKGYDVHYQEFVGGHDYLSWRGTLADGLLALIGTEPQAANK